MVEIDTHVNRDVIDTPSTVIKGLRRKGVDVVRLSYSDIHGIARGKDVLLEAFEEVAEKGIAFCLASLIDDLAGISPGVPGLAADRGYPDIRAKPLLSTLTILPWEPETAWCLVDFGGAGGAEEEFVEFVPRDLLKRAMGCYGQLGLEPVVGPELEFFLLSINEHEQIQRYTDNPAMMYTVGRQSDPQGIVRKMLKAAHSMGLPVTAAYHECWCGQFEINMLHCEALNAADRAFRCKVMIKELAAVHGLLATFIGKPFNDAASAGFHIHISIRNQEGANVFAPSKGAGDLSLLAQHFLAGVIEHASALMAFLAPTINAYKRFIPDSSVPTAINWGYDNRTTFIRVLHEQISDTRIEIRGADGAANPYLAIAVCLLAGLDGIQRKLTPPAPVSGNVTVDAPVGQLLPSSLEASLTALQSDTRLCEAIGRPLINAFCAVKRQELKRFHSYVTDWERKEYMRNL